MINISAAEKAKWESGRYTKEIKLYFPSLNLTILNNEIYGESMVLKESLFDGNGALEISGCVASSFTIEIRHQPQELKGYLVIASIRIDNGKWMALFRGYVDSVETVKDRSYQKLICYDAMQAFGARNVYYDYYQLGDTFTVKQLRDTICGAVNITQKTQTLANDSMVLNRTVESGQLSFIDAMKAICQINGVFGIINRSGQLEYRKITYWYDVLPYPSDDLFPGDDLYPGSMDSSNHEYIDAYQSIKYEDYEVACINEVIVCEGSSDEEPGSYGTGDNVLLIDDNIFIGDLEEGVKYDIAANIYSNVAEISYRPFDVSVLGRPYIEVGDAVSCYVYDYSSGEPVTYVMAFSILTRTLKGIQWLRDEYSASGEKYQPEIKLDKSGASGGSAVNEIKEDIKEINNSIEDLQGNKQNFIHLDILEPTWDAPEGDIILNSRAVVIDAQDHRSGYQYVMWRRTNNQWEKMQVAQYSQVDLQAGVSDLPTGEIYLVYE